MIQITEKIFISEQELIFTADRSSGPGGQNVNKVSTRVTLMFDVKNSPGLHPWQKERIARRLSTRINKEGVLRIVSQQTRSQAENRALAVERFVELLKEALKKDLPRKKTKIPLAAKRRRLDEKKHQSRKKQQRSSRIVEE
ncbi:MAG: aminoacyl-tRNA hydrolase [Phycisphaerae bacterium]|jgi:ribosome-associated protein|nr:aminoacyl-tRNA hydrolase [Phycisphaerae bacterium]